MFKKALIASAMLVSVISANAAGTAAIGVTGGTTPGACNIVLGGTGTADFGILTNQQLRALPSNAAIYGFGAKDIAITVTCSAATSAKLAFTDNKPGKVLVDSNISDAGRYGVVDGSGTVAIGGYDISFNSVLVDGAAPAGFLSSPNGTAVWTASSPSVWGTTYSYPGYTIGFKKTAAETVPSSFTTLAANLHTILNVNRAYMDSATNAVTFNGSGVITLSYL